MVHSDLYQTMVTIYVGPESYAFQIYKELLCHDSPFFKAALEGNFKEGNAQTVSLPEDDVETFKIYQTWLNTMQLRYNFDHVEWWLCFAKLWVLADKIGSTALKNRTVDAICATIKHNPKLDWVSSHAVCYTFDNTSWDSPLRILVVSHALITSKKSPHNHELEDYPMTYVSSIAWYLLRHAQSRGSWETQIDKIEKEVEGRLFHEDCSDDCCRATSKKKRKV